MDENQTINNQIATRISTSSSSSSHKVLRCTSLESSLLGGGVGSRSKISSSSVCTTAFNSTINEVNNDALLDDLRNEDQKAVSSRGMHSNSNWHSFPSAGERATLPSKHRRHFLSLRNYKFNENEEIAKKAKRDLLKTNLEKAEPLLEKNIKQLATSKSKKEKLKILSDMLASIDRAWSLPSIGRDLAYKLCDVLRNCNGINLLLTFLSPEKQEAQAGYDSEKETKEKSDKSKLKLGKQEWYGGKSFDSELEEIMKKDRQTPQSPLSDPAQSEHEDDVPERDILLNAASVLAQSMTVPNRKYVANYKNGLDIIISVADRYRDDPDVTRAVLGILECLFKHTEETCTKLINCGGLDAVLYACRYFDVSVLRPCAVALANLALYGDDSCQQSMITKNAPEWLFPLAFSEDDGVKYYAFLAIAALGANKSLEVAVAKSGTLHLVEPFVRIRDPVEFGTSDRAHMHGHAVDWLARLVPLLSSKRVEVQSLVTFHFAMEAAIRNRQGRLEIFKELNIIDTMKELSRSNIKLPAKFSNKFLEIIGEQPVMVLSPQIMLWNTDDICVWLTENDVKDSVIQRFKQDKIDIDLFLQLNDEDLKNDYGIERAIERKKFLRGLTKLKQTASYDSSEIVISAIDDFLKSLGPEYRQYVYQMSRSGVESSILRSLTEENLLKDCGVTNGVHRLRILEAAKKYSSTVFSPNRNNISSNSNLNSCSNNNGNYRFIEKSLDVFISYRRSNGSQLASLLKVHLQLRGFSVFLDIEKLPAGKFDDSLITSIHSSRNFILVLTPNALDRCIGDVDCKDWIHREIVAAMNGGCNIIPVIDNFVFPSAESLPEDIKNISYFNGIRWIHDYQDACVDKLEQFINGTINSFKKNPNYYYRNPLSKASSTCMTTPEMMTSSASALSSSLPMSAEILVPGDVNNNNNNNNNVNDIINVSTTTTITTTAATTTNGRSKPSQQQLFNVDAQSTLYSHKQTTVNGKQQQPDNNSSSNNNETNILKNINNNSSNNTENNDDNRLMSQSTSTTSLVQTFTINDPDDDDDDDDVIANDASSKSVLESSIN